MKKLIGIFVFCFLIMGIGFVTAQATDVLTVKTTVLESVVGISVPENVLFQDIAPGYISERQDVEISNDGTVDVSISPELDVGYTGIFENVGFRSILTDPVSTINNFDFEIVKPTIPGGTREDTIYMYLDLEDYTGNVTGYQETQITFIAVPL